MNEDSARNREGRNMNLVVQTLSTSRSGADVGVASSPVFAAARFAYSFVRRQLETVTTLYSVLRGDFRGGHEARGPHDNDRDRT